MNGILLKKIVIWLIITVFFVSAIAYGLFSSRFLIEGPLIEILSPKNGAVLETGFVTIQGIIKNSQEFSINGRTIFISTDGSFQEKFMLYPNQNYFFFTATDKFGRSQTQKFELIWQNHPIPSSPDNRPLEQTANHDTANIENVTDIKP